MLKEKLEDYTQEEIEAMESIIQTQEEKEKEAQAAKELTERTLKELEEVKGKMEQTQKLNLQLSMIANSKNQAPTMTTGEILASRYGRKKLGGN